MTPPFLNLLPPSRRRQFDDLLLYDALRKVIIVISVAVIVSGALLLAGRTLLARQLAKEKASTAQAQARLAQQNGSSLEERIREFNALLLKVNGIQTGYVGWMPVANDLFAAVPAGVALRKLEIDATTRTVIVAGLAERRDDLLALEDALLASKHVTDPTSPISNLLQREQIPFEIRFTLVLP